ncbi:MAG: MarR family transcriptional regulator [Thermodesulfobacteriota bacterium]|nr:MarR family transcriptional regulator [Thermodesulfobacteriota bacterium]
MKKKNRLVETKLLAQAKLVFTTGKMIRDRVFSTHMSGIGPHKNGIPFNDLTMPQFHTLLLIQDRGSLSVKELAHNLHVTPPSASVMVAKLVDKGLLVRNHSLKDRRKVEITLSKKAAEKIDAIEKITLSSFVDLVEKLGTETTDKWCEVLEKIQNILKKEQEPLP